MKMLKKAVLMVLVLALVVSVCGCAFGGNRRIGKKAALQAALDHAGLTSNQVTDIEIEFEKTLSSAWYEVDFESGRTDYDYRVDAYSGEILSSVTD